MLPYINYCQLARNMFVPLRKAVNRLGLHPNTLRRYADEGKIRVIKNAAGQRLFDVESYISQSASDVVVCYARVSARKQRDDLDRQVAYLYSLYPNAEFISDIGSGINFKRKGLRSILDRLLQGDKLTLVVAHRDRLARFGFELIQYMVEQNGGKIMVLDQTVYSPESELTADILSILHVFSCRVNGLRKYSKKIKEDSDLPKPTAAEDSE